MSSFKQVPGSDMVLPSNAEDFTQALTLENIHNFVISFIHFPGVISIQQDR